MTKKKYALKLLPSAERDLSEVFSWYEEQRRGLGSRFFLAVEAAMESIKRTPLLFPIVHRTVRRARVKRFPYGVYFEVAEGEIVVIRIYHARRDPRRMKRGKE